MLQQAYARTYVSRRRPTPHTTAIGFVIALHAILAFALINALKPVPQGEAPRPPIDVSFDVDTVETPIPPPTIDRIPLPPPEAPPTGEVVIRQPLAPNPGTTITTRVPGPAAVPTPVPEVVRSPARAIAGTQTGPAYPPISRRLAEQGTVRLRVTVGTDGRVTETMLLESSGFERLDNAAAAWVVRHWRYEPAMEGNRAIESRVEAVLTFRLE